MQRSRRIIALASHAGTKCSCSAVLPGSFLQYGSHASRLVSLDVPCPVSLRLTTAVSNTSMSASQAPDTVLDFIATFSPPGNAEQFFRTVAGLGHDYGDYGKVGFLQCRPSVH